MNKHAVLILGIARSGTSALTGVINRLGVPLGEDLKMADWQNPKGSFEHNALSKINMKIQASFAMNWFSPYPLPDNWRSTPEVQQAAQEIETLLQIQFKNIPVFAIKDPRLVSLFQLYVDIFNRLEIQPIVISSERNQQEVMESVKRSGYHHHVELTPERADTLYQYYMKSIQTIHQQYGGIAVKYDELLANTESTIAKISSALPITPDQQATESAISFIDQSLHRIRVEEAVKWKYY